MPLTIAGLACFVLAGLLGGGAWFFFGSHEQAAERRPDEVTQLNPAPTPAPAEAPSPTPEATPAPTPPVTPAPAGELSVAGGTISLGGEGADNPARRASVEPFAVAETEVTNEQYQEFVRATNRAAPTHWNGTDFPPGAAKEPVTNVSWQDAADYCRWLSEKISAEVRLPTEAEWELAARGADGNKYPWGNEWNERAAESQERAGRVRAVKSFPAGRSPAGAYDMAGNVWEWVADEARDAEGNLKKAGEQNVRLIKGGSANEPRDFVSATSRYEVPADFKGSKWIGFRYVVRRGGPA